jgi:2,4-dienoyl-CoA reductase-like NADH-dependent reductase (Old Yellow Enzyme family)
VRHPRFPYLFSPLRLGPVTLPNRIVFSAHLTNLAERNRPGPDLVAYYAARARGGAGLIITEEQSVHPTDHAYERLIKAFDESVVPAYRALTSAVHAHGTPVLAQINHNGGQASSLYTRLPVWAPSPVADPLFREVPKAMDAAEIAEVVAAYARVARHVRDGGFDGAELQASHSSLLRQFLSPHANRRTDAYGGSVDRRARIVREVVEAVRAEVGSDFVLGVRVPGDELIDGGLTLEHTIETVRILDRDGLLDYYNTSLGTATHTLFMVEGSMHLPPGYQLFAAAALREVTDRPVVGVGRGAGGAGAGQRRLRPGRHGPPADRRAGDRPQGSRGPCRGDPAVHLLQPGLHRPRGAEPRDRLHREPGIRPRADAGPGHPAAGRPAAPRPRGGRRPRRDAVRGGGGTARLRRHAL